tara:strand:+ start:57488 stop:58537 length:1050 start_codon:yes stop_codon:yes gene_type:complete
MRSKTVVDMKRHTILGAVLLGAALFASIEPALAGGRFWTLPMPGIRAIEALPDGTPVVVDGVGGRHRVRLHAGQIVLQPAGPAVDLSAPPQALPDAVMVPGAHGLWAWLDQPATRYEHGVLGDAIEAGGLSVGYPDGSRKSLTLPKDRVFEDRAPRFVDIDGDGRDEILTVTSYLDRGAALTLVDPGSAGGMSPRVVAEAAPIGTPNRWLNPIGAGDIDDDGRIEMLAVITPHIGGTLTAYEWHGDALSIDHELNGFSNHAIGSRELGLSGMADLDTPADGIAEVIVPDQARRAMTVVRFTDTPRIVSKINLSGRIVHRLVIYDLDGDQTPELIFGLDDGSLVVWKPGL